jgi:hypothetical protein
MEKVLFSRILPPVSGVWYGGKVFLLPCSKNEIRGEMALKSPQM